MLLHPLVLVGAFEGVLTAEEVSDNPQVSKSTGYRWVHCNLVPYVKIGGAVRFEEKAVRKWLKARECRGRPRLPVDVGPVSQA